MSHPVATSASPLASVTDRATFLRLRRTGHRARRGPVTVAWVPGGPDDGARVAYSVGRPVGGAVVRNRVRRRLRAVARESRPLFASGAYLVAAKGESATMPYAQLRSAFCEALGAVTAGGRGARGAGRAGS